MLVTTRSDLRSDPFDAISITVEGLCTHAADTITTLHSAPRYPPSHFASLRIRTPIVSFVVQHPVLSRYIRPLPCFGVRPTEDFTLPLTYS